MSPLTSAVVSPSTVIDTGVGSDGKSARSESGTSQTGLPRTRSESRPYARTTSL